MKRYICTIIASLFICSCSLTTLPRDTKTAIKDVDNEIDGVNRNSFKRNKLNSESFVQHASSGYLGINSIPIADTDFLPPIFSNTIQIDKVFYDFKEIAELITNLTKIPTLLNTEKNDSTVIRITQNEGNLVDLLNMITRKSDTSWTYQDHKIIISDFQTKRWHIDALPGEVQMQDQIYTNSGIQGQSGGSGLTAQSQSSQNANVVQNVAFNIQNNLWNSLKESVKSMLSKHGSMSIDPSTSSIVVTDKPSVIQLVDNYIKKENADINKQVMIDVQVLQVGINKNDNYGINWNVALSNLNTAFSVNGQAVTPGAGDKAIGFKDSPVFVPNNTTQAFIIRSLNGDKPIAQLIINALSSISKTSLITNSSHATMSYQPSPFQFVNQIGYLASVQTTQTQTSAQTSLLPGQITVGYSLNILPVVKNNNQILLQISLNLSSLNGIKNFSSNGSEIQLPDLQLGNTMQKITIRTGETFVISGFDSNTNQLLNQGVGGASNWLLGGGVTATNNRSRLVILITPHIISS